MRKLKPGEKDPNPKYYPGYYKEWDFGTVRIVKRDPIFDGLPDEIVVPQRHYAECKQLPAEFDLVASSAECKVQVIKRRDRLVYGTQFHPEIYDDAHPHGKVMLQNFSASPGPCRCWPARHHPRLPERRQPQLANHPGNRARISFA
jgi:GMP synthase-like glutamine amidotransferase